MLRGRVGMSRCARSSRLSERKAEVELSQSEREAQIPADQAKDELSMQRVMFSQLSSAISRYHSSSKGLYLLRA